MKRKIVTWGKIFINFLFSLRWLENPEIRRKKEEWHLCIFAKLGAKGVKIQMKNPVFSQGSKVRVSSCPLSEDNQKLRSGCPPDYQIFWGKYFENKLSIQILTLSFANKNIILIFAT